MNNFKQYLKDNLLNFKFTDSNIFEIEGFGKFLYVEPKEDLMIVDGFELNTSDEEEMMDVEFFAFKFGENYFYTEKGQKLTLKPLKYLGEYVDNNGINMPFLGVHGGYELLNGSRSYKDWIKKAKFLNIDVLGICEKNTLGGALNFQLTCKKNNIIPIVGEQIVVKNAENTLQLKCFVKNKTGWKNLLLINKEINVVNDKFIYQEDFLKLTGGLLIVVDTKYCKYEDILPYELNIKNLYYQVDTVIYSSDERDKEYLLNLKKFIYQDSIKPILISDAYYLDEQDNKAKDILELISGTRDYKSKNQYFKSPEDNFSILQKLFEDEDDCVSLLETALSNLFYFEGQCTFEIQTNVKFLPRYKLTQKELSKYKNRDNLFYSILEEQIKIKVVEKGLNEDKYFARIEEELTVIQKVTSDFGDGIDYFLILWDIVCKFCPENNIYTGHGRGSAAGSLIAYLIGITKIDPFKYDLLFSRFLNEGRVLNGSLPDIDIDFPPLRREEVFKYVEERYGSKHFCQIGTYTALKTKAALKDISKQRGVDFSTVNAISKMINYNEDGDTWEDLFKSALKKKRLKAFILKHPDVFLDIQLILNQPKSTSIHASAAIIVPDEKSIFKYMPVRKINKNGRDLIVSEWEGYDLEKAGYLKLDILSVNQLDKYQFIVDLIKKNRNINIDIYNLPLDIPQVYESIKSGYCGDIFQFGTRSLEHYCKELKPSNIYELIDAVALYRPGAIEVNAHNEYIFRKEGKREVKYLWGTEKILKYTYGLIVFQEQVMKIVSELANFSLLESDDIRRAVGKKKFEVIEKYKDIFINRVIEKGCPEDEAKKIWHELEVHSSYSFNKSHAASYTELSYVGLYLKYYYPVEFWTAAFQFDKANEKQANIPRYISEIRATDSYISISAPDVNESGKTFSSNHEKGELYWSLERIKQVGEKALENIIEEREKNGKFFDLEDFLDRVNKRIINKAVVENLILAGCFDKLENLTAEIDRISLINRYYKYRGERKNEDIASLVGNKNYWWQLKQKEVSGYGEINYKSMMSDKSDLDSSKFLDLYKLNETAINKSFIVAGIVKSFVVKSSKKGEYCRVIIDSNNEEVEVLLWSYTFKTIDKKQLKEKSIIMMDGKVVIDNYKKEKAIHSRIDSQIFFVN